MSGGLSCFGEGCVSFCQFAIRLGPEKVIRGVFQVRKLAADDVEIHERVQIPGRGSLRKFLGVAGGGGVRDGWVWENLGVGGSRRRG
jgi:hypothetical protein